MSAIHTWSLGTNPSAQNLSTSDRKYSAESSIWNLLLRWKHRRTEGWPHIEERAEETSGGGGGREPRTEDMA